MGLAEDQRFEGWADGEYLGHQNRLSVKLPALGVRQDSFILAIDLRKINFEDVLDIFVITKYISNFINISFFFFYIEISKIIKANVWGSHFRSRFPKTFVARNPLPMAY